MRASLAFGFGGMSGSEQRRPEKSCADTIRA